MNIELSNLKSHFFSKKNENEEIIKKGKKNYKTKIVEYCFYSINEVNITNKITKIPYYSNFFYILEDYDFINIGAIREKVIEKLKIVDESKKYLLFTYNGNIIPFNTFLLQIKDPKKYIFNIMHTFSYLLKSLIQLNCKNICFFQLSPENIVFQQDNRENPLLQNFQLSLQLSQLNEDYITNIIKKTNDYSLKPLEVHILFYLIENNISTISYSFIEEIVEVFIRNLNILSFFSQSYKENYKNECISFLKKYINTSKKEIISQILSYYNMWDVYSISLLYLHIFINISNVFSLKQTFINKFILELFKNINPDPSKRSSLNELLESYNNLCIIETDWYFVNSLDNRKMDLLFENLDT